MDKKAKAKTCLVSCSVLKDEIHNLIEKGELDVDVIFVSKYHHVEYAEIEKNLRPAIEKALKDYPRNVVLVYGDLCLGMNDEMKKLADEYGIVKIDALNCIDCQLGGKGKYLEADPNQDLMFMSPGMTDFFKHARDMMRKEGIDEEGIKQLFNGIRGIVLVDTMKNADQLRAEVEKLNTGLEILDTLDVGCQNVKNVIQEAIERNEKTMKANMFY